MCDIKNSKILNPSIPTCQIIPFGLQIGKMIEIKGNVPYGSDSFQINLAAGEDRGSANVNKLLHLSIRFTQYKVVKNAFLNGTWGQEEIDGAMPFATGKPFVILILVDSNCYRIAVDGRHYWEFAHRLDIRFASHLSIIGSVVIQEIKFFDQTNQTCILPPPTCVGIISPEIISSPQVPFNYSFPGGIKPGTMITIGGRPFVSAHSFAINLQSGKLTYPPPDIGFHLSVRFNTNTIVRNTRVNNSWQNEETQIPYFAFAVGRDFDIILKIEPNKILMSVNGKSFIEFHHRSFPISKFDTLHIENDIILSYVKVEYV